jgi:hypothetical protein
VRLALLLAALLCGCGSFATTGEQGPKGDPGADGAQGPIGPEGPPGSGGCVDGPRLKCVRAIGSDGSSVAVPMMFDSAEDDPDGRDEYCTWQMHEGGRYCLPPFLDATEPSAWVDAGCPITGPWVMPRLYTPADYPDGTSVVRLVSSDVSIHGRVIMRKGPVSTYYAKIGGGPCAEAPPGFIPDPHEWYDLDATAFVGGMLEPAQ